MPCKPAATAKTAGHPRLTPARSFRDDIVVVRARPETTRTFFIFGLLMWYVTGSMCRWAG